MGTRNRGEFSGSRKESHIIFLFIKLVSTFSSRDRRGRDGGGRRSYMRPFLFLSFSSPTFRFVPFF